MSVFYGYMYVSMCVPKKRENLSDVRTETETENYKNSSIIIYNILKQNKICNSFCFKSSVRHCNVT